MMKTTASIAVWLLLATLSASLSLRRSNVRTVHRKPEKLIEKHEEGVLPRLSNNVSKPLAKLKLQGAIPKGSVKMVTPTSHGKCVKIESPKVCTGTDDFYYGTVGSHISKASAKEISEGISKIFDLLPMVSVMLKPEDQAKFQKCLPSMSNLICHSLLPRCNLNCEQMKPCQSACNAIFNGCIPKDAVKDIGKVRIGGSYRPMILGAIGAAEGSPVMTVVDSILDSLSDPTCSNAMYSKATGSNSCLGDDYRGGTCGDPVPVDFRKEIAKKTHDNIAVLKRHVNDSSLHKEADGTEKEVYQKLNVNPEKDNNTTSNTTEDVEDVDATGATGTIEKELDDDKMSPVNGGNLTKRQGPTSDEIEASIINKAKKSLNATKSMPKIDAVNATEETVLVNTVKYAEKLAQQTLKTNLLQSNKTHNIDTGAGRKNAEGTMNGAKSRKQNNLEKSSGVATSKIISRVKMPAQMKHEQKRDDETLSAMENDSNDQKIVKTATKSLPEDVDSIDEILISQRRAKEEAGNAHWQWVGGAGFGSLLPRHHQKLAKQQNVVPYESPETGRASQSIPTTKPISASNTLVNSNKTVQSIPSTIPYSKEENQTNSNEPIGSVEEKGSVKCGNVTCAPNAHCVENECTCNPGFTGNGKKCVSDHAYDTVNDDGERQVAREPTTLEKGFGRVVEMEKKKAKDAIETEIKKAENFIDNYQSQMSQKIHKVEDEILGERKDESEDQIKKVKPSPKELLFASVIKSEKGKAKTEIQKQIDKAERFITNYERQLSTKIDVMEQEMNGATGASYGTGMTGLGYDSTGLSTGNDGGDVSETSNTDRSEENGKRETFNNLVGFAVSKAKKNINEDVADAMLYMDKYTSKLSDVEKKIEREMDTIAKGRNESQSEAEYVKPYYPTDREKAAASVAHLAAETAKAKLQKELDKAYGIIGVESDKLSKTLKQTKLELNASRSTVEEGEEYDQGEDYEGDAETGGTGSTGVESTPEEPATVSMTKQRATSFVIDTLTQKGKSYLANLVDKASDLIDENVEKGQILLKKVMHELNESRAETYASEDMEVQKPRSVSAREKTINNFVHTAAETVKSQINDDLEDAYADLSKYESQLVHTLKQAKKEIKNNTYERLRNETQEEGEQNAGTNISQEENGIIGDIANKKESPICKQVDDIPGCPERTFMATFDQKYSVQKYRTAINEFFGALPILATLTNKDHQLISECLSDFHRHTCNVMFPKCSASCEAQLPCTSSCRVTGKCQELFDKSFLGSMLKGGEHYDIIQTITSVSHGTDNDSIEIIGNIVHKFTTECGKQGVYASSSGSSSDTCSSSEGEAVRKCTPSIAVLNKKE